MNVYYLPARELETPEPIAPPSRWSILTARMHRAYWRLRLTASEVWRVVRRGATRPSLDDHLWFTPATPAPRRRALGPARIIDLDAARRRRATAPAQA